VYWGETDRNDYWGGPERNWSYLGGISLWESNARVVSGSANGLVVQHGRTSPRTGTHTNPCSSGRVASALSTTPAS
jgi:hypothetical protein